MRCCALATRAGRNVEGVTTSGREIGGEGGIRTPGPGDRPTVFKTAAFDRSATSPWRLLCHCRSDLELGPRRVTGFGPAGPPWPDHTRRRAGWKPARSLGACGIAAGTRGYAQYGDAQMTRTTRFRSLLMTFAAFFAVSAHAQPEPLAHPADLAFEQGRWQEAIDAYRELVESSPDDGLGWLRIAQAERELGRHERALETLERARAAGAPEAMLEVERARNLLALGRREDALEALEAADHFESRAATLLERAPDFDPLRGDARFDRVVRNVRRRVSPCLGIPEAAQLDFWVGRWEARAVDGTLIGNATITREDGGCSIV